MYQVPFAHEETLSRVTEVARDLAHPEAIRLACHPGEFHPSGRKVDEEQDDEPCQSFPGPGVSGMR